MASKRKATGWLLVDLFGAAFSGVAIIAGLVMENTAVIIAGGFFLLFWQREYYHDLRRAGRPE